MKKLCVLILLLFVVLASISAETKRKSRRTRHLIEKIDVRLDSVVQTPVYENIQGRKYHRFSHGVLTTVSDTVAGVFIAEDRIHFKSYGGDILFSDIVDKKKRIYRKNLKQLLCVLEEPW